MATWTRLAVADKLLSRPSTSRHRVRRLRAELPGRRRADRRFIDGWARWKIPTSSRRAQHAGRGGRVRRAAAAVPALNRAGGGGAASGVRLTCRMTSRRAAERRGSDLRGSGPDGLMGRRPREAAPARQLINADGQIDQKPRSPGPPRSFRPRLRGETQQSDPGRAAVPGTQPWADWCLHFQSLSPGHEAASRLSFKAAPDTHSMGDYTASGRQLGPARMSQSWTTWPLTDHTFSLNSAASRQLPTVRRPAHCRHIKATRVTPRLARYHRTQHFLSIQYCMTIFNVYDSTRWPLTNNQQATATAHAEPR